MPVKKNCQICIRDLKSPSICGCLVCLDCLLHWFQEKSQNFPIKEFSCPNGKCGYRYTFEQLLQRCSRQPYQEKLQSILVKQHLQHFDIRPCPNIKCCNYGFFDVNKKCDDQFQCDLCHIKWNDYLFTKQSYLFKDILPNIFGTIFNILYLEFLTQQCPSCGTYIERNGGCKRIICSSCKEDFCWSCGRTSMYHDDEEEAWCIFSQLLIVPFLMPCFLNLLYLLGVLQYLYHLFQPLYVLKWLLILVLINPIIFMFMYRCYMLIKWMYCVFFGKKGTNSIFQIILAFTFNISIIHICVNFPELLLNQIKDHFSILLVEAGLTFLLFFGIYFNFYTTCLLVVAVILLYYQLLSILAIVFWLFPYFVEYQNIKYLLKGGLYVFLICYNQQDQKNYKSQPYFLFICLFDFLYCFKHWGLFRKNRKL